MVKHMTIYQRTPNLCLPMKQWNLDPAEERRKKEAGEYDKIFDACRRTFTGFQYDFTPKKTFDDAAEDREKFFHQLFDIEGGFQMLLKKCVPRFAA